MIRLADPAFDDGDLAAVTAVLRTGNLVQGRTVAAFEAGFAALTGSTHAVAVANCTAALHLALLGLELAPGDEVAVPAFSWPSTANAVSLVGATPVFTDIDPHTWAMSADTLDAVLATHPRIRVVLPVHPFGAMAPMPALLASAARHGLPVIEDAACASGAVLQGKAAGQWGRIGCFSFHPRKIIATGEGGMLTTSDDRLARRFRILRNHGLDPDAATPDFVEAGYNLRLTEFQAALGLCQLERLPALLARRRALVDTYRRLLEPLGMTLQHAPSAEAHVHQAFVSLLPAVMAPRRDAILAALRAQGVECSIGTYHIPLTRYFRETGGYAPGDFPVTDDVHARAIALPLHDRLADADLTKVADALASALTAASRAG
jgi:dTDP-4-amino-4,6-dideoxygalactose transaminase